MWRLDLAGYALFSQAGAPLSAAGASPASCGPLPLRTHPPHVPGQGSSREVRLPFQGVCLCEKGFLERFTFTVTS